MGPYYLYTPDSDRFHSLAIQSRSLDDVFSLPRPVHVTWYRRKAAGNFPGLRGTEPGFDERALAVLRPLLGDTVEVLPLVTDDPGLGGVYAIHVLPILDCLDPDRSELDRFDESTIIHVTRHAFREDVLGSHPLFRIRGLEHSRCYVSEAFRKTVEGAGLKGLQFKPLLMA